MMKSQSRSILDTPLEPVIGLAEGETRWRGMTASCGIHNPDKPCPRLQRRKHGAGDIRGAVAAAEFHRLDATGIDLVDRALDALAGRGRGLEAMLVGQPVQHHGGGKDHARRVGLALSHDVGRGAVAGWNTAWRSPMSAEGAMP